MKSQLSLAVFLIALTFSFGANARRHPNFDDFTTLDAQPTDLDSEAPVLPSSTTTAFLEDPATIGISDPETKNIYTSQGGRRTRTRGPGRSSSLADPEDQPTRMASLDPEITPSIDYGSPQTTDDGSPQTTDYAGLPQTTDDTGLPQTTDDSSLPETTGDSLPQTADDSLPQTTDLDSPQNTESSLPQSTDLSSPTESNGNPSATASIPASTASSSSGKICINWSGDFHFLFQGGFGDEAGQGGEAASKCWDTSVTSAAMFICESECNQSGDAAPAKYTKFECTLSTEFPNCDMSLVDGFSLPAACSFDGSNGPVTIGGTENLMDLGCDSPAGDNSCYNDQGYSSSVDTLKPLFKQAAVEPNNYCSWQTCQERSDPGWDSSTFPTINCVVGQGGKSKRNLDSATTKGNVVREAVLDDSKALSPRELGMTTDINRFSRRSVHARSFKDDA